MKGLLRFVLRLTCVAAAIPARAQVQTGSILVKAVDQQGAVVPGVTITITSPVLVSGSMTAVTDAGGTYRFPSLVPGTYEVKLELSGFQSVVRQGIPVLAGRPTPIQQGLNAARAADPVTARRQAPHIHPTNANR